MQTDERPQLIQDNPATVPAGQAKWRFPPVHREGYRFAAISAAVTLVFALFGWDIAAWLMVGVTVWVFAFFRDPKRVTPQDDRLIVAPADGMVCLIQNVMPPREIAGPNGLGDQAMIRVSIFMSVFDVHINRTPIAGTVRQVVYISGKFLNADLDKASEDNERQHFVVERSDGLRIGFTQIAGLVARRILAFAKPGDIIAAGQRIGLIRFGSRVDVFLPTGTAPLVALGQRCVAGETVLARLGENESVRGVVQ